MILRSLRWLVILTIVLIVGVELGSQSTPGTVVFTAIPAWGQDGAVAGSVFGSDSQKFSLYIFAFVPDLGWFGLPQNCAPVPIQSTGQFSVNATPSIAFRSATRFTAYLMPANLAPQCDTGTATVPFIFDHNAISSASIPRLAQYSTILFGGLDWYVKEAPIQVYPGPQFFVKENAFVDSAGRLHLRITPCGSSWCAAEIYTKQKLGYGTYRFTINSPVNNLDPNVTLGLFSWDGQAGDQFNREWDMEFGRWGNVSASANAQYVVQPFNGPGNIFRFLMSPANPSTHNVSWMPTQLSFSSTAADSTPISQWVYSGATPIPTPGDVRLHMNFYVAAGQGPRVPATQEVIISGFQYTPTGAQIGLSRTADAIPFQGQSYSVPLSSSGSNCSAVVESDSPWLSVIGSSAISPGASVQYSVLDNFGGPRIGNLLLRSTNCNATLGGQILTVTQDGLVCTPSFADPSTHIGFVATARSVFIRGTAAPCTWTVSSSAPWLRILSSPSGAGDGSIQIGSDANSGVDLRQGVLSLNNGQIHTVYQDAAANLLALSPLNAPSCGGQPARFGLSWVALTDVEIRLGSPTGDVVGQFGPSGTTLLPQITDGTLVFMLRQGTSTVLATARATLLPQSCTLPGIAPLGLVNAASYKATSLAPGALSTVFGTNLSSSTAQASGIAYPTVLGGATVTLAGRACQLWYASPSQINFVVPSDLAPGRYLLSVATANSDVLITNVSPGIFTVKGDGTGVPLAMVAGLLSDGSVVSFPAYQCDASGCKMVPIVLPDNLVDLYITLYGTGIRGYHAISASVGSNAAEVLFVGAHPQYPGLDQVNLHVVRPSALSGVQSLVLQVDGVYSNSVTLQFQ